MKLYTYTPAPNARRLDLFQRYKGIDIETYNIDLMKQEQFHDSYKAINPHMTVPALLLDDGTLLTETVGICHYLEALYPEKPLLGKDPLAQAQVISYDHQLFVTGFMAIAEVLRNANETFKDRAFPGPLKLAQIPALIERGNLRIDHFFQEMNALVATKNYLVGDALTLADIDLIVTIDFAGWVEKTMPEDCQALKAYHQRISQELNVQ